MFNFYNVRDKVLFNSKKKSVIDILLIHPDLFQDKLKFKNNHFKNLNIYDSFDLIFDVNLKLSDLSIIFSENNAFNNITKNFKHVHCENNRLN